MSKIIVCTICEITFGSDEKYNASEHTESDKHKNGLLRKAIPDSLRSCWSLASDMITLITNEFSLGTNLCTVLLFPETLYQLLKLVLINFLEEYPKNEIFYGIPLLERCVNESYNKIINEIRKEISNNKIWVNIDETTDAEGRYIASVFVGILNEDYNTRTTF